MGVQKKSLPKRTHSRRGVVCYTFTMSEDPTNDFEDESDDSAEANRVKIERGRQVAEIVTLARELSERREVFAFPGLDPAAYAAMKATEQEYPGYGTPVDKIIARMQSEGIKVVFG